MNDLKNLIRQYPELGDVFADLETRLLFLENSLPFKFPEEPIDKRKSAESDTEWGKNQWAIINQLRGMVQFLYLKETERRANASKRKTNRYIKYTP